MLFKKNASVRERVRVALASVQRNAYAMNMLRSRLESRINFALTEKGSTETCQELTRILELVRNGEIILNQVSERIESTRFLEEFIVIMDSASLSVSEIKGDLEQMVPVAEAALEEMNDAISKVSSGIPIELRREIEPAILAEVTDAITSGGKCKVVVDTKKQAATAQELGEEESEPVPA